MMKKCTTKGIKRKEKNEKKGREEKHKKKEERDLRT
jgi:hypothetical protein